MGVFAGIASTHMRPTSRALSQKQAANLLAIAADCNFRIERSVTKHYSAWGRCLL
jgi:hypothetical protein